MEDAFIASNHKVITLSLALETDVEAINTLLAPESFSMPEDWANNQFRLKATQESKLVATCCFGMVKTKADLNKKMGNVPWDETFPIATISKLRALPGTFCDRYLKFISLFFADQIEGLQGLASEMATPGHFGIRKDRFQDLLKLSYSSLPGPWEWQGLLPYEDQLPSLKKLESISEYVHKSMQ